MPTFLSIEPANYCMLRCPECPVGIRGTAKEEQQTIPLALCRKVIDEASCTAHTIIFHFQGEPLLHPELKEMIRYAHSKRLYTMLSTNAQLLSREMGRDLAAAGLDRIIISMDGLTPSTYEHYRRGGHLEKVLEGMRALAELPRRERPEIVLQCLLLRSNEHEWELFRRQYKALGADRLELKTAQLYDFAHGHPDMPSDPRYSRYQKGKDGLYHLKKKLHNRCYRLWSGCVITTSGEVLPCCFDKEHTYSFGNIRQDSLAEVLHSDAAYLFRDHVLTCRRDVSICRNCSE